MRNILSIYDKNCFSCSKYEMIQFLGLVLNITGFIAAYLFHNMITPSNVSSIRNRIEVFLNNNLSNRYNIHGSAMCARGICIHYLFPLSK
jgi:hypothetical protein